MKSKQDIISPFCIQQKHMYRQRRSDGERRRAAAFEREGLPMTTEKQFEEAAEAENRDIDYSLSRVPASAKQPFWRILFIRIGAICCVSQLMLGAALGYGMTFFDAFVCTMLGSVLLQVVSWALGTAAAREGLSTSLLSRW